MDDDTTVFLTDQRRDVLTGDYDGAANTERTHQSRIRSRARSALAELIEVAESDAIENESVFDPDQLRYLLTAIMQGGGGLDPYEPPEDYQNAVYVEVDRSLRYFQDMDDGGDE